MTQIAIPEECETLSRETRELLQRVLTQIHALTPECVSWIEVCLARPENVAVGITAERLTQDARVCGCGCSLAMLAAYEAGMSARILDENRFLWGFAPRVAGAVTMWEHDAERVRWVLRAWDDGHLLHAWAQQVPEYLGLLARRRVPRGNQSSREIIEFFDEVGSLVAAREAAEGGGRV